MVPAQASRRGAHTVAYFSMEFMLSEALPIYSGGLGNVAGDQMKAASDLGVPVVGVGLLYGQGYFRQDFDSEGRQQALYPVNDPGQLPIRPLRQPNGEWLRLQIQLPGSKIWLRCWEVSVGRAKLYLLDTNDFANTAAHRGITSELYGGDAEMRLKQEIVLGIGGWRLLRALGLTPEVCHLNEGHAAFAVLERARSYMEDHKKPFDLAMNITRAGNVFTTHTAVSAGFDRFDPRLIRTYLTTMQWMNSQSRWMTCSPWEGRIRKTIRNPSTWLISRSAAAGRSMASASSMGK
jgi:starch phosphorylase